MKLQILLVFFLMLVNINFSYSQVTIGSNIPPNNGALLDLKEKTPVNPLVDNATAGKGLGLPRVKLTSKNNLYPMFQSNGSGGYIGSSKNDEDKNHIGLVVYCVAQDETCPVFKSGVHVWDGEEWIPLHGGLENTFDTNTGILRDEEGNEYTTKLMPDGKRWTTQNLRSLKYPGNTWIDNVNGVYLNPAIRGGYDKPPVPIKTSYPSTTVTFYVNGTQTTLTYEQFAQQYGLLYTAAQVVGKQICPCGWHIATTEEWAALGVALGGNKSTYNDGYKITNIGDKLSSDDYVYIGADNPSPVQNSGYAPGSPNNSGFNGVPAGYVYISGPDILAGSFGQSYNFISADGKRVVSISSNLQISSYGGMVAGSVRCVQD